MNKIWLIIQREYLSRVKKKSFLITTFLVPILILVLTSTMVYVASKSEEKQGIAVIDQSGIFKSRLDSTSSSYSFTYLNISMKDDKKKLLKDNECDILLQIYAPANQWPDSIHLFKDGGVSLDAKEFITNEINSVYRIQQMTNAGINQSEIDSIQQTSLAIKSYDLKNNQETNSEVATLIGYVMGFLIYLVILIYGMSVMRGVSEEKTNRIAEVIISSVRPFQLMIGKIIGIALVGLTQFILWLGLSLTLQTLLPLFFPSLSASFHVGSELSHMQTQVPQHATNEISNLMISLFNQNWPLLIFCFLFYFLGGYFLYAAMFAAVGSIVNEDAQEAQQLTVPITMPIIFGFVIMASTIKNPNSSLSIFGSMFPLTSPIVMMARIPYGISGWQILLSMMILVLSFIGMTWISAKIYRTGILMYGKKISWFEMFKWLRKS